MLRAVRVAIFLGLSTATGGAAADDVALDLFNRGLAHMLAGRQDAACPLIAQSYEREPLPGTLFTLAECEAQRGHLAAALRYHDAYLTVFDALTPEKQAKQRGREKIAAAQRAALGPRVPTLTVTLPEGAPAGTVVRCDGRTLGASSLGAPMPLDPGDHVVTAEAPGRPVIERRVTLAERDRKVIALPVDPPRDPRRTAGFVAVGLGAAGLLASAITGGLALGEKATADARCADLPSGERGCDAPGKAAADRAQALARAGTVGFGAGAANLALGAVLLLVGGSRSTAAPPRTAGLPEYGLRLMVTTPEHGGATLAVEGAW